jgi:hypothetical protein
MSRKSCGISQWHTTEFIYLQSDTSTHNGSSDLCYGTCNEEAGRDNSHHGSEGKDGLHKCGRILVGCHSDGDGSKDDLRKSSNECNMENMESTTTG